MDSESRFGGEVLVSDETTFAKIPSVVGRMLAGGQIKPIALATFYGLAKFADNETGECWPSRAQIAEAAGYSKADAVDVHLKALEAAGAISVQRRGYRSTSKPYTYAAVRDDEHPVRATSVYRLAGFGGTRTPEMRGTPTPEVGGTRTPETGVVTRPIELDPKELAGGQTEPGEDQEHDEGAKANRQPTLSSETLARGIRSLADEHRVKESYVLLSGGGFVRKDHAHKLTHPTRRTQLFGDTLTPKREDFSTVSDDNYRAAKEKNLIRCGWLAQKQRESVGKANPGRWLTAAISGEPARELAAAGPRFEF